MSVDELELRRPNTFVGEVKLAQEIDVKIWGRRVSISLVRRTDVNVSCWLYFRI
jgi:hypothetical protein